jgi:uncharacterized protein (DUF1697 family)
MSTFIALLRGVNVGGKNKLPMKDLSAMFVAAGCVDVRTYIQSGNVLFTANAGLALRLPDLITTRFRDGFGYRTPVILRTAAQLAEVASSNPFLTSGAPRTPSTSSSWPMRRARAVSTVSMAIDRPRTCSMSVARKSS